MIHGMESEKLFRNILDNAPIGMAVEAASGRFIQVNRALCDLLGYENDQLLQLTSQEITHEDDLEAHRANVRKLLQNKLERFQMDKRYIRRNGKVIWAQLTASLLRSEEGAPLCFISQVQDISQRRRYQEQIEHLAYYDNLTNLPNRRLILDRFCRALAQAKRYHRSLAIMFMDLDYFKQVNDSLGHDVGDELLKVVAKRLKASVRNGDTVCRQGGDEFVVLLTEIAQSEDASGVAEKIVEAMRTPIQVGEHTLNVTMSIGIAVYPIDGTDDPRELMKKADKAMYQAKEAGRNQFTIFR